MLLTMTKIMLQMIAFGFKDIMIFIFYGARSLAQNTELGKQIAVLWINVLRRPKGYRCPFG